MCVLLFEYLLNCVYHCWTSIVGMVYLLPALSLPLSVNGNLFKYYTQLSSLQLEQDDERINYKLYTQYHRNSFLIYFQVLSVYIEACLVTSILHMSQCCICLKGWNIKFCALEDCLDNLPTSRLSLFRFWCMDRNTGGKWDLWHLYCGRGIIALNMYLMMVDFAVLCVLYKYVGKYNYKSNEHATLYIYQTIILLSCHNLVVPTPTPK